MPSETAQRGAAPVGHLAELGEVESSAIIALRLWCDGARGEIGLTDAGLEALGDTMQLLLGHGRRKLMRHGAGCSCLGGDEACFAQLVALAACGEQDEALMLAMLMVRADMAPGLAHHAGRLGRAIAALGAQARRPHAAAPVSHVLH
ncbi:hypothetical protein ACXN5S_08660 [Pseudoroseicyclus sp. H15]